MWRSARHFNSRLNCNTVHLRILILGDPPRIPRIVAGVGVDFKSFLFPLFFKGGARVIGLK